QVERDGELPLVQPFPIEAVAVLRLRPAAEVRPAAALIDADDLGAHLSKVEAGRRTSDERRRLHHPEPVKQRVHRFSSFERSGPASPVRHAPSSPTIVIAETFWIGAPPRLWLSASCGPSARWRSPARPCTCRRASSLMRTAAGPPGGPN